MFINFNSKDFFAGSPSDRLLCLDNAAQYIQLKKEIETRFMSVSKRMKVAYENCSPTGSLIEEEYWKAQFYIAIRAIIYKQSIGNAPDTETMNKYVAEMVKDAISCTGVENIINATEPEEIFGDVLSEQVEQIKMPISKFQALLKLLKQSISSYRKTNQLKAGEFDKRLKTIVDKYNNRDKLVFTSGVVEDFVNELSDNLIDIINELHDDKESFKKMGMTFEEKAFYDILVEVRDKHQFQYDDEKCKILAKEIKKLVDDKSKYTDWSARIDVKNQLSEDLTVLLYKNGYPPEWDDEIFEQVLSQAENFKKFEN